jgi:Sec-independent protein translocase protein TatA
MALFKYFFIWSAVSSSATYMAFSLGPSKLPLVSRNAGRTIGMWFNYFKVMIRVITPEADEANIILSQYRKGSQQAHAFTREFKSSLQTQKSALKKIIPELGEDPLKKLRDI